MRKHLLNIVCIVVAVFCYAQPGIVDSLKLKLAINNDTLQMVICHQLNEAYNAVDHDSDQLMMEWLFRQRK